MSAHRVRMLVVVGVVAALFAGYSTWTGMSYMGLVGGGRRLTAYLPTSGDALGPASPVKYHGLVVGRVIQVTGRPGHSSAEIVVKAKHSARIPANVTARVLPSTIFGSEFIDLVEPLRPSTASISSIRSVPADRSTETLRIMDAVAAGERILRAVDPGRLDATVSALAALLDDNGADLGRFLHRASSYLGGLIEHSDAFYRDLRLLGSVLTSGADAEPHLVAALRNSHDTLRLVVTQRRAIDRLIAGSTGLSTEADRFVRATEADLTHAVWASEPVVGIYHGRRGRLADLLRGVPRVLRNGTGGIEGGRIRMEGLMQFPFDFGDPYLAPDCTRLIGATASNCPGGPSYHSPYRGKR